MQTELKLKFVRLEDGESIFHPALDLSLLPSSEKLAGERNLTDMEKKEFIASLNEHGQLQAILVGDTELGMEIVEGRKRVLCLREAGYATVKAEVCKMTHEQTEILRSVANNLRSENDTSDIHTIKYIMDRFPSTADAKTIAWLTKIDLSRVKKLLRMAKLSPVLFQAAAEGHLTEDTLNAISKVPNGEAKAIALLNERKQNYEKQADGTWKSLKTDKPLTGAPTLVSHEDIKDMSRKFNANALSNIPTPFVLPKRRTGFAAVDKDGNFLTGHLVNTPDEVRLMLNGQPYTIIYCQEQGG